MPKYHKIAEGECLATIANLYGFTDYNTIWNDGNNAKLKATRPNANILAEGDILYIPDKAGKDASGGTSASHPFQVGGATVNFKIIIKDAKGQPFANKNYSLDVPPDQTFTGVTGSDGLIQQTIPVTADSGTLTLTDVNLTWQLHLGHLDPATTLRGVQGRLNSLGYNPGDIDGNPSDTTTAALKAFQTDNQLTPADGSNNATTQAKLVELHGC